MFTARYKVAIFLAELLTRASKTVVRARLFVAECCRSIHPRGALRWAQCCAKYNHEHDREDDRINYRRTEVNEGPALEDRVEDFRQGQRHRETDR
jgi:hypothetical protein